MKDIHPIWKNFFVLEGLDGSGTTSQLKKLTNYCESEGISNFGTWEPTDQPIGKLIRRVLHQEISIEPETMARLFTADRYEHLYGAQDGIRMRLDRGEKVFCDRYLFSSLAYQSLGCDFDKILDLNPFPLPEKVFYVDVTAADCLKRRSNRDIEELYDALRLQEELAGNYRKALRTFEGLGMEVHMVNGSLSIDEVFEEIKSHIFT
ncbi:MAG: dTMP kinase [Spirochaetales bacterium]|nr:dTMP kinase [Spirochaetales bacterium]